MISWALFCNIARVRNSIIFLLLFCAFSLQAQTSNCKLISWNIRDLGRSKSDAEIAMMAQILKGFDVIAIQEVVAKDPAGAKAVARLADALDRTGNDYDYVVSNPTRSSSPYVRERYAFLWKTSTIRLAKRPRLVQSLSQTIEREPYLASFIWENKSFYVANFHARPHDKQPEQEIKAMKVLPVQYGDAPLFIVGDFNVVSHHSVFNPWLKKGYKLAIKDQKTTLRRVERPDLGPYARQQDNMIVPAHQVQLLEGGTLDIYNYLGQSLAAANALSDHIPVYIIFDDFPQLDGLNSEKSRP